MSKKIKFSVPEAQAALDPLRKLVAAVGDLDDVLATIDDGYKEHNRLLDQSKAIQAEIDKAIGNAKAIEAQAQAVKAAADTESEDRLRVANEEFSRIVLEAEEKAASILAKAEEEVAPLRKEASGLKTAVSLLERQKGQLVSEVTALDERESTIQASVSKLLSSLQGATK